MLISRYCRILRTPRVRLLTAVSLNGSVYHRTVGRSADVLTAEVILAGNGQKALLEDAFRAGAVMRFSADEEEEEIFGIITDISYTGDRFAGVRRAEVTLSEVIL